MEHTFPPSLPPRCDPSSEAAGSPKYPALSAGRVLPASPGPGGAGPVGGDEGLVAEEVIVIARHGL